MFKLQSLQSLKGYPFGSDNKYVIDIANSLEARKSAYSLVYETYLKSGLTNPLPSRMWITKYDMHPDSETFIVKREGMIIGAITFTPDSPLGLPADELYSNEVNSLRAKDIRIGEMMSLSVKDDENSTSVVTMLYNAAYLYAYKILGISDIVIGCTTRHAKIYRRSLRFTNLGPPKLHSRVNNTIGCLEHLEFTLVEEVVKARDLNQTEAIPKHTLYKNFMSLKEELGFIDFVKTSRRKMSGLELQFFFTKHSSALFNLKPRQLAFLEQCYPAFFRNFENNTICR